MPVSEITGDNLIFIVGMPRSGTTLCEKILTEHAKVYGAGELNDIIGIASAIPGMIDDKQLQYPHYAKQLTPYLLTGFGKKYLARMEQISNHADAIVNKLPANCIYIGLILQLFPKTKIIHMQRNPYDTCLSCFFQNFANGQEYTFDLDSLGRYYLAYQKLMTHWHSLFADRILDIQYETLVEQHDEIKQRMYDFCRLKSNNNTEHYVDEKLAQHAVCSASRWQVRQPLYNTSIERWQRYESHLKPLRRYLS